MTPEKIIFGILAVAVLSSSLLVVTTKNLVRAALWLVLTLFSVAGLYVLLEAGFFAVVQVVVYIGAIAILFIFAVMLTRNVTADSRPQTNSGWWVAALLAATLFGLLVVILTSWRGISQTTRSIADSSENLRQLGQALVSADGYVIPFEVASVLLVAAMIGAIYVAWARK